MGLEEMDDDRVAKGFRRIQMIATLERESEIIASYREGLAAAWLRVSKGRYNLGRLGHLLGVGSEI